MDTNAVVEAYVRAWHEDDETTRRRLLDESWAADGVYCDPNSIVVGRDALLEHIAEFREQRPDVRIEVRSGIDEHGTHFRFGWATVDGAGSDLRDGIDVGQLDDDGRIASIIGFFGPLPPRAGEAQD